jgi:hypothetical protein
LNVIQGHAVNLGTSSLWKPLLQLSRTTPRAYFPTLSIFIQQLIQLELNDCLIHPTDSTLLTTTSLRAVAKDFQLQKSKTSKKRKNKSSTHSDSNSETGSKSNKSTNKRKKTIVVNEHSDDDDFQSVDDIQNNSEANDEIFDGLFQVNSTSSMDDTHNIQQHVADDEQQQHNENEEQQSMDNEHKYDEQAVITTSVFDTSSQHHAYTHSPFDGADDVDMNDLLSAPIPLYSPPPFFSSVSTHSPALSFDIDQSPAPSVSDSDSDSSASPSPSPTIRHSKRRKSAADINAISTSQSNITSSQVIFHRQAQTFTVDVTHNVVDSTLNNALADDESDDSDSLPSINLSATSKHSNQS